jgi:hypothetical protein
MSTVTCKSIEVNWIISIDCGRTDVTVYFSGRHTVLPAQLMMNIIKTVGVQLDIFIQQLISITSVLVFMYQLVVQCKWRNSISLVTPR